jgi:hypothetical protein
MRCRATILLVGFTVDRVDARTARTKSAKSMGCSVPKISAQFGFLRAADTFFSTKTSELPPPQRDKANGGVMQWHATILGISTTRDRNKVGQVKDACKRPTERPRTDHCILHCEQRAIDTKQTGRTTRPHSGGRTMDNGSEARGAATETRETGSEQCGQLSPTATVPARGMRPGKRVRRALPSHEMRTVGNGSSGGVLALRRSASGCRSGCRGCA